MEVDKEKIYSISEFVAFLNADLKWMKAGIVGEVGEAKAGPSGHMYFTLKDGKDGSMLNCIMWASKYRLFGITLEPGKKIVAYGSPEVYAPNGRLSFVCDTIELAGEGDIKKQYDELKKKLEKEGIFAPENKRKIPSYPQKIGVITSMQGAVIHDFKSNLKKFGFKVKILDSRVEGQGAVEDLLTSIRTFRKTDIDVLVIIRGGGSLESLMPFNNELLVREVVGFPVPVLVGIGHDKDVPLVALAADKSESTPTAVANLLNESYSQALLILERRERDILEKYGIIIKRYTDIENKVKLFFQAFRNSINNLKIKLINIEKIVEINNPERQLKLGYSIARTNGKIIRSVKNVNLEDVISIKFFDGTIDSQIKKIK